MEKALAALVPLGGVTVTETVDAITFEVHFVPERMLKLRYDEGEGRYIKSRYGRDMLAIVTRGSTGLWYWPSVMELDGLPALLEIPRKEIARYRRGVRVLDQDRVEDIVLLPMRYIRDSLNANEWRTIVEELP